MVKEKENSKGDKCMGKRRKGGGKILKIRVFFNPTDPIGTLIIDWEEGFFKVTAGYFFETLSVFSVHGTDYS